MSQSGVLLTQTSIKHNKKKKIKKIRVKGKKMYKIFQISLFTLNAAANCMNPLAHSIPG